MDFWRDQPVPYLRLDKRGCIVASTQKTKSKGGNLHALDANEDARDALWRLHWLLKDHSAWLPLWKTYVFACAFLVAHRDAVFGCDQDTLPSERHVMYLTLGARDRVEEAAEELQLAMKSWRVGHWASCARDQLSFLEQCVSTWVSSISTFLTQRERKRRSESPPPREGEGRARATRVRT
jgi:hypothetical protein